MFERTPLRRSGPPEDARGLHDRKATHGPSTCRATRPGLAGPRKPPGPAAADTRWRRTPGHADGGTATPSRLSGGKGRGAFAVADPVPLARRDLAGGKRCGIPRSAPTQPGVAARRDPDPTPVRWTEAGAGPEERARRPGLRVKGEGGRRSGELLHRAGGGSHRTRAGRAFREIRPKGRGGDGERSRAAPGNLARILTAGRRPRRHRPLPAGRGPGSG